MTDLERFRDWVLTCPDVPPEFAIDYTNEVPNTGAIFPNGLVEVSRREDVLGNVTVHNQYNFALYYVYEKNEGDDVTAKVNQDFVMAFQLWIQEQSARKLAPTFGNRDTAQEIIRAQNGALYDTPDSGVGVYYVLVSVQFTKYYGTEE